MSAFIFPSHREEGEVMFVKECSHITEFTPICYSKILVRYSANIGYEPILSVIQPITINTILNNNWLNNGPIFLYRKSG